MSNKEYLFWFALGCVIGGAVIWALAVEWLT